MTDKGPESDKRATTFEPSTLAKVDISTPATAIELYSSDFSPTPGIDRERNTDKVVDLALLSSRLSSSQLQLETCAADMPTECSMQPNTEESEESGLTVLDRIMNWLAEMFKELDRRLFSRAKRMPPTQRRNMIKPSTEQILQQSMQSMQSIFKSKKRARRDAGDPPASPNS